MTSYYCPKMFDLTSHLGSKDGISRMEEDNLHSVFIQTFKFIFLYIIRKLNCVESRIKKKKIPAEKLSRLL